ncbi:4-alpha-glucanotransferase [compost metagenome]
MMSVADRAIFPMQDLLGLGSEARLNTPGKSSGNWSWRFRAEVLNDALANRLAELTLLYARSPLPKPTT